MEQNGKNQNLSNTVYRIEIGRVERTKNSITDDWTEGPRNFFLHFRIPGVTKHEKKCFQ